MISYKDLVYSTSTKHVRNNCLLERLQSHRLSVFPRWFCNVFRLHFPKRSSVTCREISRPKFGPGPAVSHVETRHQMQVRRSKVLHLAYNHDPSFDHTDLIPLHELHPNNWSCIAARDGSQDSAHTPHMANCLLHH